MARIISLFLCILLITGCANKTSNINENKYLETYTLATNFLLDGDYDQAIINFLAAIEIDDKNIDAYLGLYQTYLENGDLEAAETFLNSFKDKFDDLVGSNGSAYIYFDLNNLPVFNLCDENGYLIKEIRFNKCLECDEDILCTRVFSLIDNYNVAKITSWIAKVDSCVGEKHNFCYSTHDIEPSKCPHCGQTLKIMDDIYYFDSNGHISMRQFSPWYCDSYNGTHTFYNECIYYENDLPVFSESYNSETGILHFKTYFDANGNTERGEYYGDNGALSQIHYYKDGIFDYTEFVDN